MEIINELIHNFEWRYDNSQFYLHWDAYNQTVLIGYSPICYPTVGECISINLDNHYEFSGYSDAYYISMYHGTTLIFRKKIYPHGLLTDGYQDITVAPDNILQIAYGSGLMSVQLYFDFFKALDNIIYTNELYDRVRIFS